MLRPFNQLPYGAKFRYPYSDVVFVRIGANLIASWPKPDELLEVGGKPHQSLCVFWTEHGTEGGLDNRPDHLVEVVEDHNK